MAEDHFFTTKSGCRICYQVFGDPLHPAILIISGHGSAMTQKTDELVALLSPADDPHFLVRFDHRDTGRSTSFVKPPGEEDSPMYSLGDMVDDVVGLIKHLNLKSVHIVGVSLGGTIAWQTACRLPDLTSSLALILTSPVGRQQIPGDELPPLRLEGQWLLGEAFGPPDDLEDDQGWIESYTRLALCLSTQPPTDEERAEARKEAEITYYREKDSGTMWTKMNHSDVSGERWPRELLKQIKCPTVVIHGAKDQIFPIQHAEALRDDVPGAQLVVLEDCGHEIPPRVRRRMADVILANSKRTRIDIP